MQAWTSPICQSAEKATLFAAEEIAADEESDEGNEDDATTESGTTVSGTTGTGVDGGVSEHSYRPAASVAGAGVAKREEDVVVR